MAREAAAGALRAEKNQPARPTPITMTPAVATVLEFVPSLAERLTEGQVLRLGRAVRTVLRHAAVSPETLGSYLGWRFSQFRFLVLGSSGNATVRDPMAWLVSQLPQVSECRRCRSGVPGSPLRPVPVCGGCAADVAGSGSEDEQVASGLAAFSATVEELRTAWDAADADLDDDPVVLSPRFLKLAGSAVSAGPRLDTEFDRQRERECAQVARACVELHGEADSGGPVLGGLGLAARSDLGLGEWASDPGAAPLFGAGVRERSLVEELVGGP